MPFAFNPFTGKFDLVSDLSGYVPYTGAVSTVDLGAQNFVTTGTLSSALTTVSNLIDKGLTNTRVPYANTAKQLVDSANMVFDGTILTTAGLKSTGLIYGTGTTGSTPVSGAGTRLMWIPAKAAFRAGAVSGTQWNDANIGTYSFAISSDSTASGYGSVALGQQCTASGARSLAFGYNTTASNSFSESHGASTTASGYAAISFGASSTASGTNSLAAGYSNASGSQATSFGYGTIATGNSAWAGGVQADLDFASLCAGSTTADEVIAPFAFGYCTTGNTMIAGGDACIVMGQDVNAPVDYSLGMIGTVSITDAGTGYAVNDVLTITTGGNNATVKVLTISDPLADITGHHLETTGYEYYVGETGYVSGGNYDAYWEITGIDDQGYGYGPVTTYNLTAAGTGYTADTVYDTQTVSGSGYGFQIHVDTVGGSAGNVWSILLVNRGTGYSTGAGQATTGAGNNDCTISVDTLQSTPNRIVFGRGFSASKKDSFNIGFGQLDFQLTSGKIDTSVAAATDLIIETGAAKTIVLATTVYDDMQFQVSYAKVPAANYPTWETFTTNTSEYAFSVNDYIDSAANELPHWWKQGTAGNAHLHFTLKTIQNSGANRYAKFTVTFAYADTAEVWTEQALTAEYTIPTGTAALTNLYLDLGDLTFTNYLIGAQVKCRIKRIAATGGTEYADDVYITQVGVHLQKDTMGSRQEIIK
jgi:hypothetical protein